MDKIKQSIENNEFDFTSFINEKVNRGTRLALKGSEIPEFIINNNYSAIKYKFNRRKKSNAQDTRVIVLDIDEPQTNYPTLNDIKTRLKEFNHIIATTRSHQIEKNGVVCDRYRILLFISEAIANADSYKAQVNLIASYLNINHDKKCVNINRLFYKSKEVVSSNFIGNSFLPIEFNIIQTPPKADFKYRIADCELPIEIQKWIYRKELGEPIMAKREQLIRILICQKNLLHYNPFSQVYMARYLNIRRNTFKTWFDDLITNGWLVIFSEEYGKGWKTKTYKAKGILEKLIMDYHGFRTKQDFYKEINLPTEIQDGKWHPNLFFASFKFSHDENSDNYIRWVMTLSGWDQKTRIQQAHNAFKDMKEYVRKNFNK